ncbi:MAG: mechanosensitive ion channel family protein, partial [Pseudomonadota bacterium]|nr:mechanosensitive ion channel family protein [Pseudomonadota bacterium]
MNGTTPVRLLGIEWVGVTAENGRKLAVSVALIVFLLVLRSLLRAAVRVALRGERGRRRKARFWAEQSVQLAAVLGIALGLLSIWFDDPTRLATAFGLLGAGVAFALQRVITAFAGYVVILNGETFTVGDRINMGGVRGDVLAVGFMQT